MSNDYDATCRRMVHAAPGPFLPWLLRGENERRPDDERGSEYQLLAVVVNLTGTRKATPASRSFVWPGKKKRKRFAFDVWEWHLAEESAKATLAAIARKRYDRAILPWVPLMAGGSEPANRARWLELARSEPDDRRRVDLGYHTRVLAEKSADPEAWLKDLEGWEKMKSPFLEATRQEGRVESRQEDLVRILRVRTRREAPGDLVAAIRGCPDLERLAAWMDVAAVIDTLEQFRQQTGL